MPARKKAPAKKAPAKRPFKVYYKRRPTSYIPRVSGRGAYTYENPGPWGRFGRAAGKMAGGMLGSNYGLGKAGADVGSKLGSYLHYIGKIFGSGDYVTAGAGVKSNNLVGAGAQAPLFSGAAQQVRIRHREYLGDIISSSTPGAFQIQGFNLNPGVKDTYPWLAQVCGATFQQYRINGQVFEFRSMSSDALNSTNTALGQVIMATDYDSKDAPFTSKQQMENTMFGVSCKPSVSMIHAIECAKYQTAVSELYIRANAVPEGADPRLYDMGIFYVATNGCQGASVNLGELWVSYDITLFKPIEQPPGFLIPCASYQLTGVDSSNSMGTVRTSIIDQIGLTFPTATAVQLPLSTPTNSLWIFYWIAAGDSTASVPQPTLTYSGGMSAYSFLVSSPFVATATTVAKAIAIVVKYDGSGTVASPPRIIVGNGVVPANNSQGCFISLTQTSSAFPG
ncbi:MAG: capsid protein [Malazfec virus 8]